LICRICTEQVARLADDVRTAAATAVAAVAAASISDEDAEMLMAAIAHGVSVGITVT